MDSRADYAFQQSIPQHSTGDSLRSPAQFAPGLDRTTHGLGPALWSAENRFSEYDLYRYARKRNSAARIVLGRKTQTREVPACLCVRGESHEPLSRLDWYSKPQEN